MKNGTIIIIATVVVLIVVGYFVLSKKNPIDVANDKPKNTPQPIGEAELVENSSLLIANKNGVKIYLKNDLDTIIKTVNKNQIAGLYTGQNTNYYYIVVNTGLGKGQGWMVRKTDVTTDFI